MRIALLEDDPDHGAQLQALLEGGGHHVHLFTRGRPLLNRLAHESFDVIVLDIEMPIMDGITAARSIRRLGGEADIGIDEKEMRELRIRQKNGDAVVAAAGDEAVAAPQVKL